VMELLASNAVQPDRAVVVVTHDSRVFHHAHTIARMDDGRIVEVTRRNGSTDPKYFGEASPFPKEVVQ